MPIYIYKIKLSRYLGLAALGLLSFLLSCTDVIEIDIEESDTLLVVDAWLTNLPEEQVINLSLSMPFLESSFAKGVTDAQVQIVRSDEKVFIFEETEPGKYIWNSSGTESLGDVGATLELNIIINEENYTSSSEIFPVPVIDSITTELRTDELIGPDGIYTNFFARDLVGLGNTYWIKTYKNGIFLNKPQELNIAFDAGFDGGAEIDGLIFIPPIREMTNRWPDDDPPDDFNVAPWIEGDHIRVEIHSISNDAFNFLQIAREQMTNGDNTIFALPLANAKGNIHNTSNNGRALGVFSVSAVSKNSLLIE